MILGDSLFQTEVLFNTSPEPYVPTILVKIDTTATGINKVKHQLPNWSGDTWTPYSSSWEAYKNKTHVKYRVNGATIGDYTFTKHCVLVHESNDPNVPVGTKYGSACPTDIVAKTCSENSTIVNGLCECDDGFELVNGICVASGGTSGRSDDDDDDDDNGNDNGITTDLCESVICSDINRDEHADDEPLYDTSVQDCCGECSTGYEEDDNGECQSLNGEEGTPWILYGGLGLAVLVGLIILKK